MLSAVCDECGHQFRHKEALCHNWREPAKAFGCPSCHTFYVKEEGKLTDSTKRGILAVGIVLPAAQIFWRSFLTQQYDLMVQSGAILISFAFLGIYPLLPFGKKLVRSSYQPGPSSTSS